MVFLVYLPSHLTFGLVLLYVLPKLLFICFVGKEWGTFDAISRYITQTSPCNILQYYTAEKNGNLNITSDNFPIFAQNIDRGNTLEPPQWGGSNEYPQSMF